MDRFGRGDYLERDLFSLFLGNANVRLMIQETEDDKRLHCNSNKDSFSRRKGGISTTVCIHEERTVVGRCEDLESKFEERNHLPPVVVSE